MDEKHPKLLRPSRNLDEKQKQTVGALRSQLSTHSTSSSATGDDCVAKLTGGEVLLLRKCVQTLTTFKADSDSIRDDVDGRRVDRNRSVESFLFQAVEVYLTIIQHDFMFASRRKKLELWNKSVSN